MRARVHHVRSHAGDEIDFVLEGSRGRLVGLEVKSSATSSAADAAPLRKLAAEMGSRFVRGVVLYAGDESVPFDQRVHALPISASWSIVE